jgi:hypothetical protein
VELLGGQQVVAGDLPFHLLDQLRGAAARLQVPALDGLAQGVQRGLAEGLQLALGLVPLGELAAAQLLDELVDLVRVVGAGRAIRHARDAERDSQKGQQQPSGSHMLDSFGTGKRHCEYRVRRRAPRKSGGPPPGDVNLLGDLIIG